MFWTKPKDSMGRTRFKRPFWIVTLTSLVFVLAGTGALAVFLVHSSAASSKVCAQCHAEIVRLWENSKGHPSDQTKCFQCHSEKRRLLPDGWNLLRHFRDLAAPPEYSADDALTTQRCLDCHPEVIDSGYELKKKVVTFNHRIHHQEYLDCISCHRGAGHEYIEGTTNRPTVSECLDCHYKEFTGPPKSQKCLTCHEVILAPGRTS